MTENSAPIEEVSSSQRPPSAWNLSANPLLRRFLRSQLRWRELLIWVVLMLSICAWMTLAMYGWIQRRENAAPYFAARCAWVPLLFLQSFILLFQGTSSLAAGMVREGMDGMIRYQRLTPLSPLAKVIGYWLGLPVRAWVLFALTLPFSVWLCTQGQIPLRIWLPIYSVMISTALLYHLTGLLLGLVIPQGQAATRVASFLSYLLVSLYLLLPGLGQFGLLLFQYLTVRPVFIHKLYELDPEVLETLPGGERLVSSHLGVVPLFGLELSETSYTFLIQGILGGVFLLVQLRRWRDPQANPLGKVWAVLLGALLQGLLLGNALPLIASGSFFHSRLRWSSYNPLLRQLDTPVARAYIICVVYGLVSLILAAILLHVTIASQERIASALRRSLRACRRIRPWSDASSAGGVALILGLMTAAGWHHFCEAMFASTHLVAPLAKAGLASSEVLRDLGMIWCLPPVALAIMWLLFETYSRRVWSLFALLGWMLPTMVGTLALIWQGEGASWALRLVAISPFGQAFGSLLPALGQAIDHWWARELALWAQLWIALHAVLALGLLIIHLRFGIRRRRRLQAEMGHSQEKTKSSHAA